MFRKSALAMAMLGALTTGNVVALGLGDIELKSALNQPLNAEVELLSATQAELEELKIEMGSSQAFENAGIDRPLFLTKLRFDVRQTADGKAVVQITSRDAIREPFLDFLLQVSWSKGRLLREYTVLVDPPVTMPAAAPVPQAPAVQSAAPRTQSAPLQPARRVTHTAQTPPVSAAPGEYGPTRRNDTLWSVAQKVRPDAGVSIEQTMLGLLRANPEAFQGNNINNLKAGYILRVPSRDELTSISRAEAARESRAQYAAWREARGLPTPTPVERQVAGEAAAPGSEAGSGSSLQLVAPEMGEETASDAGGAETGDSLESLQQDLMLANETLEEQRRQGEEMSQRLSILEEQIVNMQRLIQLKDDELARLQSQAGDESVEQSVAEQPVVEQPAEVETAEVLPPEEADGETVIAEETVELPSAMGTAELADTEPSLAEDVAPAEMMDAEMSVDESMAGEPVADDFGTEEAPVEELAVAPEPEPAVVEPVVPDTYTAPGFVDRLMANPLWLGAGAVVLALLAFFGLRRKRNVETEFQESILQAAQEKSAASASDSEIVATEPESRDSTTTESSLLSEFAVSDMGSIKNDSEADPLAEADVYLAYGRYQQAEDLIKDALENDPAREELNLKLLEVFMAGKNQAAFDEHAQDVLARLENSADPMWQKIAEMGRELSPENPIYQAGNEVPADLDEDAGMDTLSEDMEFGMDEGVEAAETSAEAKQSDDEGLDFDIDLSYDASEVENKEQPDSVEFTPPEDIAEQAEVSRPELNANMDSVEPDAVEKSNDLDFDLEGLDLGGEVETEVEPHGDGELADLDEVSTKLDLARAYIDMGDPDGAKSILDEVMEEGSADQKDEARGIMEQMT